MEEGEGREERGKGRREGRLGNQLCKTKKNTLLLFLVFSLC